MFTSLGAILFVLSCFVLAIAVARWLSRLTGQTTVLFELMLGIVAGNLGLWIGHPIFEFFASMELSGEFLSEFWRSDSTLSEFVEEFGGKHDISPTITNSFKDPSALKWISIIHVMWAFSSFGVLLLLFSTGLETSVSEMRTVGTRAIAIAIVGIIAPFLLAYVFCWLMHLQMDFLGHTFLAATLSATSVGISARVFEDLNRLNCSESRLIVGAAVIDDVLGLILLSLVVGAALTGTISIYDVGKTLLIAIGFLSVIFIAGEKFAGWTARVFERFDRRLSRLFVPMFLMLIFAWLAESVHLAAIIGAFAAGLVLKDEQFQVGNGAIAQQVMPMERFFAPLFFLLVGMQVQLSSFDWSTILLAAVLTVAAVVGKFAAGLVAGKNVNRAVVGWGMVPRGEVGLVFLGIGRSIGVVSEAIFSALVLVVIATTLITPIALKWTLAKSSNTPRE